MKGKNNPEIGGGYYQISQYFLRKLLQCHHCLVHPLVERLHLRKLCSNDVPAYSQLTQLLLRNDLASLNTSMFT